MKLLQHIHIKFLIFVFIITVNWGILFILPDFLIYPTSKFSGIVYTLLHWSLICIPAFILIYILAINKYIFALFFPILTILGSIIGFFSFSYKAVLTPMIFDAALNNDVGTSLDLISFQLIVFILLNLILSILFVIYRFRKIKIQRPIICFIIAGSVFILLLSANGRATNSFMQHFPLSLYYNANEYGKLNTLKHSVRINPDPNIHFNCKDSITVVLVIGESSRADHWSLNGYKRETNPLLLKRKNLISLPNIYSEYTYTNPSLAHVLTRADSIHPERANIETSFVSLFNESGYYTVWIANQDAEDAYFPFMNECDSLIYAHPEKSVYTYSNWFDGDLLSYFEQINNGQNACKLIILHTIGSHWYYNSHVPEKFNRFMPITKSKVITQNTKEEILNSYDNTILYTDYFLDAIINQIENKNSILIYLSDHGELLGENNQWLHASNGEKLHHPSCIVWFSDEYLNKYVKKYDSLVKNKNKYYRSDFLFHSMLDAGNVKTNLLDSTLDIFEHNESHPRYTQK